MSLPAFDSVRFSVRGHLLNILNVAWRSAGWGNGLGDLRFQILDCRLGAGARRQEAGAGGSLPCTVVVPPGSCRLRLPSAA